MTKTMRTKTYPDNPYLFTQALHVPFKIPHTNLRAVLCAEHMNDFVGPIPAHVPEQVLAKLKREGYYPMLTTFTAHIEGTCFELHIFVPQGKALTRP